MNIINLFWISLAIGFATPQNNSSLSGKWILKCYKDIILKEEECTSMTDSEIPITIEFKDNGKIGKLTGRTEYNFVYGEYEIPDSNKIIMKNVGGSKVNELGKFGNKFLPAMKHSSSFSFHKGCLIIFYDNDTKAMKFINAKLD